MTEQCVTSLSEQGPCDSGTVANVEVHTGDDARSFGNGFHIGDVDEAYALVPYLVPDCGYTDRVFYGKDFEDEISEFEMARAEKFAAGVQVDSALKFPMCRLPKYRARGALFESAGMIRMRMREENRV